VHARANSGRLIELFGVLQVGHYAIPETAKVLQVNFFGLRVFEASPTFAPHV
jgi:hypothetical protein